MHELELGVWKALLIHLIRILHSLGSQRIEEFNSRYVLNFSVCNPKAHYTSQLPTDCAIWMWYYSPIHTQCCRLEEARRKRL